MAMNCNDKLSRISSFDGYFTMTTRNFELDDLEMITRDLHGSVLLLNHTPVSLDRWEQVNVPISSDVIGAFAVRRLSYDMLIAMEDFHKNIADMFKNGLDMYVFKSVIPASLLVHPIRKGEARVLSDNGLIFKLFCPHRGETATISSTDQKWLELINHRVTLGN